MGSLASRRVIFAVEVLARIALIEQLRNHAIFQSGHWPILYLVKVKRILSPRQNHGMMAFRLFYGRGDVPNGEADPGASGCVRVRAMDDIRVMKGHFSGLQHQIDGLFEFQILRDSQPLA